MRERGLCCLSSLPVPGGYLASSAIVLSLSAHGEHPQMPEADRPDYYKILGSREVAS